MTDTTATPAEPEKEEAPTEEKGGFPIPERSDEWGDY